MPIHVVRLGSRRTAGEGLRLGTVRRPPRGVVKADIARRDYYDLWVPELAPSAMLVAAAVRTDWTDTRWRQFVRAYRREMGAPAARHLIALLAALSHHSNLSVGCYCEDEARCHRRILRELLIAAGGDVR